MNAAQRGVALITAMLIVAIIAALATSLSLGQQVWLRQTQNLTDLARAEQIRQGALDYAAAVLERDGKNARTSKTDTLAEAWAQPIPPLPVDGGVVLVSISDAQARFNLNNLVQQGKPSPSDVPIYTRLLAQLGLPTNLVNPLIDWLDADGTTLPGGAEDLDYLNHDPPYRAANRPLMSIDELRLIKGYTPEIIAKLSPLVVVLPASAGPRPINVNTADATVLAALTGSDSTQAEQIVKARENDSFQNTAQFQALFPGNQQLKSNTFDVKSSYFIVSVQTRIGRIQRRTEALIERPTGNATQANVLWYRQPPLPFTIDEDKS
jgi:general secretion pathway protein K